MKKEMEQRLLSSSTTIKTYISLLSLPILSLTHDAQRSHATPFRRGDIRVAR